jgi:hypothetical protein
MKISKETANGVNEMTGGVNQINTAVNGKQNEPPRPEGRGIL